MRREIQVLNPYCTIDTREWPIVRVQYNKVPTAQEFEAHLERLDELYTHPGKRAVILDSRAGATLPAALRRRQAKWIADNADTLRERVVGMAFVLTSRLQRGAMTAILWLAPLPTPHAVLPDVESAKAWCRERLDATPDAKRSA